MTVITFEDLKEDVNYEIPQDLLDSRLHQIVVSHPASEDTYIILTTTREVIVKFTALPLADQFQAADAFWRMFDIKNTSTLTLKGQERLHYLTRVAQREGEPRKVQIEM